MKIAFDAKRFFQNASGLGNYSRDLVRILAQHFPENEYLLLNKKQSDRGAEILKRSNVSFVKTSSAKLARQLNMGREAQDLGAEIYHGLSGELPLKWNAKPIRKIVTIHDLIFLRYPQYYSWFDRKIHYWKFKKAAEIADHIIAISEQTKQDIISFLKVHPEKITVVYQGCHEAFKLPVDKDLKDETRKKHHLPERFILNVGTIEKRKNLLQVIRAVEGTEIPVVAVGKKTSYFRKIQKFISKNKMDKQIIFLEGMTMTELAAIYRMADFLIYPSEFEGFGIPVIEALFSGIPVITSNRSSLPEAGGSGALYVDPSNFNDLRAKIIFLWNNESERNRLATHGLAYVQKFTDAEIAKNIMSVYQQSN